MAINIEELKRKFYMIQYNNYLNYLRSWDSCDSKNEYCIHLQRVFESSYESKFSKLDKEKGKVIHYNHAITYNIANESQQWASVDEFFDIISRDQSIAEHVNDLVDYINSGELKNESETRNQSEDSIIKLIANYFCEQNGLEDKPITKSKKAAKANESIEIKGEKGNTTITDPELKKLYKIIENSTLKNELNDTSTFSNVMDNIKKHLLFKGLHDSLDWNLSNSVQYLQAVKDLRNNQFHHVVEMITDHDADPQVVLRFVLFTYIHVVLALRMSMVKWGKGNYPQRPVTLRVHLNKGYQWKSLGVRLYRIDRNKEVEVQEVPSNSERTKTYEVYRFHKYEIRVNGGASVSKKIGPKCFNPLAVADKVKPRFYQSETEANTRDRKLFSEDIYDETLRYLGGIKKDTGQISNNLRTIDKNITGIGEEITNIADVITDGIEEQRTAEKKKLFLLFMSMFVILAVLLYFAIKPFHKENQNILITDKIADTYISSGDSLLQIGVKQHDLEKCEQAGKAYRTAITKLRDRAEQMDYNSSIALCHMYLSGKGCYDLDSAFYYAKKEEVRATKEGQGLYAYLLLKRGETEKARREVARAIDPEEAYIRLTKALYDIRKALDITLSFDASKQACESGYQNLCNINNDDAYYEKAMLTLWGFRNSEDSEFLIHPNYGEAYNAFDALATRNPLALLALGDIHNIMGETNRGLDYHCAAFYCGIQQEAAISINLSLLINADTFTLTDKGKAIREIMAGKANVIGGVGGLLSDYIHYLNNKDYDLAVETADTLSFLTKQTKNNISINDSSFIPTIQISSRLMTGKLKDFSKAVQLAMKRDNCSDSVAVADYLKGICFAKGYGCDIDLSKSDSLILLSAKRGTYTESSVTLVKRRPPHPSGIHLNDAEAKWLENWLDYYINLELIKKSPKLACSIMEIALKYGQEYHFASDLASILGPYLPKEMRLMEKIVRSTQNFNVTSIINDSNVFDSLNDYICFAMKNGQTHMAKVGCTIYVVFSEKYKVSKEKNAYEMFMYELPKVSNNFDLHKIYSSINEKALRMNPVPQITDYAY